MTHPQEKLRFLDLFDQACMVANAEDKSMVFANSKCLHLLQLSPSEITGSFLQDHFKAPKNENRLNLWRRNELWVSIKEESLQLNGEAYILYVLKEQSICPNPESIEQATTLAGVLVHRFRSPLTGVMGFAELLDMDLRNDENAAEFDALNRGLDTLKSMLDELNTFKNMPKAHRRPVELNSFLKAICQDYRSRGEKRLQIEFEKSAESVETDPDLLETIIHVLLDNAIEASSSELDDIQLIYTDQNEIAVRNTGTIIDRPVAEQIFQPFFTTKAQSLGLGLSRAIGLSEILGYNIYLKTNTPVEGVTFAIELN